MSQSTEKNKPIKGIRIRTVNRMLVVCSCLLFMLVFVAIARVSSHAKALITATDDYIGCKQEAEQVKTGSDYLTDQVRAYVLTADPLYAQQYVTELYVTRRRDEALEKLSAYHPSEDALTDLQAALERSNALTVSEFYAMKLVAQASVDSDSLPEEVLSVALTDEDEALSAAEKLELAREMVFGAAYQADKSAIIEQIDLFLSLITTQVYQNQANTERALQSIISQQRIALIFLFVLTIVTFLLIQQLIFRLLHHYIQCFREEKRLDVVGPYEFRCIAQTYNDIYERNCAAEDVLRYKAEHDPLTGLMNRGSFDRFRKVLSAYPAPVALLLIDADHFKEINDTYGHEIGDHVLKRIADTLKASVRAKDYAIRLGGDEFALLMMDITPDLRHVISGKARHINSQLHVPQGDTPAISVSIGVAFCGEGFGERLYHDADLALYRAKAIGRKTCVFADECVEA